MRNIQPIKSSKTCSRLKRCDSVLQTQTWIGVQGVRQAITCRVEGLKEEASSAPGLAWTVCQAKLFQAWTAQKRGQSLLLLANLLGGSWQLMQVLQTSGHGASGFAVLGFPREARDRLLVDEWFKGPVGAGLDTCWPTVLQTRKRLARAVKCSKLFRLSHLPSAKRLPFGF